MTKNKKSITPDWQYAFGKPKATGVLKKFPEDFKVTEELKFEPSGKGEHVYFYIEKTGSNTQWVMGQIAKWLGKKEREVGYCGLKDRHAVTKQWFSIQLPEANKLENFLKAKHEFKILSHTRGDKKLRQGMQKHNLFEITLREINGDEKDIETRLQQIQQRGFPNYFGLQRFGHDFDNLNLLFSGKKLKPFERSIAISSVRSYLFNEVLSKRIELNCWDEGLPGEVFKLENSNSVFHAPEITTDIQTRAQKKDIHPTGPLFGTDLGSVTDRCLNIESNIMQQYPKWVDVLYKNRCESARRALRAVAENFKWHWKDDNTLVLSFGLGSGSFATSLVRELMNT